MTWTLRACVVLSIIGAIDVGWYHLWRLRLYARPQSRREEVAHLCRGLLFVSMLALVAVARPHGAWVLVLLGLFAVDWINTAVDTWVEKASRQDLGGLARGEYMVHVAGSVAVGLTGSAAFFETRAARLAPTSFVPYDAGGGAAVLAVRGCLVLAVVVLVIETGLHAFSMWHFRSVSPAFHVGSVRQS
jgi:hypothetical protein